MTIEREARVPEHPGWQPWWLRYAEYDGEFAVLCDRAALPERHRGARRPRYDVGIGRLSSRSPCICGCGCLAFSWRYSHATGFLAEAEAAFEAAARRLVEQDG